MQKSKKSWKIKRKLVVFGSFFCIVFLIPFFILKNGFHIDELSNRFFSVKQLYIKLDKKIIVQMKNFDLFKQNEQNAGVNLKEILALLQKIELMHLFFEEISVENFHYHAQNAKILFKNGEFFIDHSEFFLKLDLAVSNTSIQTNIQQFFAKDYNLTAVGKINIDAPTQKVQFVNIIKAANTFIEFNGTYADNELFLQTQNATTSNKDLQIYIDQVANEKIHAHLKEWLIDKIQTKYSFDKLEARIKFDKSAVKILDINGTGKMNQTRLVFAPNIKPVDFDEVDILIDKEKLQTKFHKANFGKANLNKSEFFIYALNDFSKAGLSVKIISNDLMFDKDLKAILTGYKIELPFTQTSGQLTSEVFIDVPFKKGSPNTYTADFELSDTKIDFGNLLFASGRVSLKDEVLKFENIRAENDFSIFSFHGTLPLKQERGDFTGFINKLNFKDLIQIQNEDLALSVNLNAKELRIDKYDAKMTWSQGLKIEAFNVTDLVKSSPSLSKLGITNIHDLSLTSKDFKAYELVLKNAIFDKNLRYTSGAKYESDDFFIYQDDNIFKLTSASKNVAASMQKNDVFLEIRNIAYVLNTQDIDISKNNNTQNVTINAYDCGILLQDLNKTIRFDTLKASMRGENSSIQAAYKKAKFELNSNKNNLSINIYNVNDSVFNEFFGKEMVENGLFSLSLNGKNADNFSGQIIIENTFLKNLKFHNQLISFIDTIPSLISFKAPTFNEKGLNVKQGAVVFEKKGKIITIKTLAFNGDSVDILGLGNINLDTKKVDFDLELKTLKSASNLIASVPFINQIILGKERAISTQIKVDGSIEDPQFHTSITKQVLKIPFNLIKNIIQMPSTWVE